MSDYRDMKITVPATSANVGPGFDSVGVAVSKYLTIEVLEVADKWEVLHDLGDVPSDETNLLGSSSSVIVAGIELANQLADLNLSDDEKLTLATKIEGHPDNVAPAIFGNLVVSSYVDGKVNSAVATFPEASFVAFIPNYELKTSDSRNVLPVQFSYKEAVAASSIANIAIAALLTGDLEKAGKAIEADLFHERFRQKLVKEFVQIKEKAHQAGAYATYLSGAGPTVMVLAPKEQESKVLEAVHSLGLDGEVVALHVDTKGVFVEKD